MKRLVKSEYSIVKRQCDFWWLEVCLEHRMGGWVCGSCAWPPICRGFCASLMSGLSKEINSINRLCVQVAGDPSGSSGSISMTRDSMIAVGFPIILKWKTRTVQLNRALNLGNFYSKGFPQRLRNRLTLDRRRSRPVSFQPYLTLNDHSL